MPKRIIIGLTGKAGHGKNIVADIICEEYPQLNFKQVGFADKVKEVYTVVTGEEPVDDLEWKNTFLPEWGLTPRQMLQKIGTDAMRNGLDTDVWLKAMGANLRPDQNYIITDVRFPNEVDYIEDNLGGKVFRVVRPGYQSGTPEHESETALDYMRFDEIVNAGPLRDLRLLVHLMEGIIFNNSTQYHAEEL